MKHMTFREFSSKIMDNIKSYLSPDYAECTIEAYRLSKPGGVSLTGICINSPDSDICPIVYLDELYKNYCNDRMDLPEILLKIAKQIMENKIPKFDYQSCLYWENAETQIISRFINVSSGLNDEYLADRPVTLMENCNIGVIYDIDIAEFNQTATIPVTYDLMKLWGVSEKDLDAAANLNNPRLRPLKLESMDNMMNELLPGLELPPSASPNMYFITNTRCCNGAVAVTYPETEKQLLNLLGDFYLLPSSIHEMIAVSRTIYNPESLAEMIQDVNCNEVQPCDVLDNVPYILKNGQLMTAPGVNTEQPPIPNCNPTPVLV